MRSRIAAILRKYADRLEPPAATAYTAPLGWNETPPQRSEPIDFDALWRGHVNDGAYYNEEADVYHTGIYL